MKKTNAAKDNKNVSLTLENVNRSALSKEFVKKIVDKTIFFANFSAQSGSAFGGKAPTYSIIFLGTSEMKKIDQEHMPRARHVSNVLTFNLSDDPPVADIFICVSQARKEAKAYGLSARGYISFLIIHGILHSIGFAHEHGARKRKAMEALEEKILFSLFPKL